MEFKEDELLHRLLYGNGLTDVSTYIVFNILLM